MKSQLRSRLTLLAIAGVMMVPVITRAQEEKIFYQRPSYWRPYDQTGINVFETSKKEDPIKFEGLRIRFGAGFTQQFQNLKHENPDALNNQTSNRLYPLQSGFMTAQANLFTDVQLADGIRLNVTTYLSSRHHNEAWVKGGYLQFDKLPFKGKFWDDLMKDLTIKLGHMEVNYGDEHFRRPDGGHTLQSPFMEGNIMDAFATEIGGEIYLHRNSFFGMIGLTNGMIKGNVDSTYKTAQDDNIKRSPSIYFKGGFDKNITEDLRLRVSGSYYHNGSSAGSGLTLYGGDRTGSNYQNVMEKAPAGTALPGSAAIAFSGRFNPGFSKKIDAAMFNAFLKYQGAEFFGTYELANGRTKLESTDRNANQVAVEGIYRIGKAEKVYVGLRYNQVKAELAGFANDVKVERVAGVAGWFLTKNILLKGELVDQHYYDFPLNDYRAGGRFHGYVIEAVVGF